MALKRYAGLAAALSLAGCGLWTDYDKIRGIKPSEETGTAFTRAMAAEYADLALYEADQMYDWADAARYARMTVSSADGVVEMPSYPDMRDLPAIALEQAELMRSRLVIAMDGNGRAKHPILAARAQARYECWLEELEERWQQERIADCLEEFTAALIDLETAQRQVVNVIEPAPRSRRASAALSQPAPAKAVAALPPPPTRFEISFDFDDSMYRAGSKNTIRAAAEALEALGAKRVQLTGHTDRAGPADYNVFLSKRRAEIVRAQLVSIGVDRRLIDIEALGEAAPKVATQDGVREAANRRVEIQLTVDN